MIKKKKKRSPLRNLNLIGCKFNPYGQGSSKFLNPLNSLRSRQFARSSIFNWPFANFTGNKSAIGIALKIEFRVRSIRSNEHGVATAISVFQRGRGVFKRVIVGNINSRRGVGNAYQHPPRRHHPV